MRIKFAFNVTQVSKNEVDVELNLKGQPIVEINFHPDIQSKLNDETHDKIYEYVLTEAVRGSIQIDMSDKKK